MVNVFVRRIGVFFITTQFAWLYSLTHETELNIVNLLNFYSIIHFKVYSYVKPSLHCDNKQ